MSCNNRLTTILLLAFSFAPATLFGQDDGGELPFLEDMVLPTAQELMTGDTFDWIVLRDNRVLTAEPLYPRPNTLEKLIKEKEELDKSRPSNRAAKARRQARLEELRKLEVAESGNQIQTYRLPMTQIQQIISHEKLMLRRVDALLEEGDIQTAYELLLIVDSHFPGWEDAVPRFEALLIREAELRLQDNQPYAALALLEELADRNIDNERLPSMMGNTFDGLIKEAVDEDNYRKAQGLIDRLAKKFPQHKVSIDWTNILSGRMRDGLKKASDLASESRHKEAAAVAREADRIWFRKSGNERSLFTRIASRYQTLRVPVRRFAGEPVVSPIDLEAEQRHRYLTEVNLFEPSNSDELTYYQSSFFEIWDPQDLGREVLFSLRQTRPYWQSQPMLDANQIADTLRSALDPDAANFNPRLASFVSSYSVKSPTQLQVNFRRVPLSVEAMFRFPIVEPATGEILSKRFHLVEDGEAQRIYKRSVPEPDGLIPSQYHVAEIVEIKFSDRHREIQAFQRKQIDQIPFLRPWEVDIFKASGKANVIQYAMPTSHMLVFNPKSPHVGSAQLRRGISFGVDREGLLRSTVLRDKEMKYGRVTSSPWHSASYASDPLAQLPRYDHYLSYLLRFAALEQLRIPDKQAYVKEARKKAEAAGEEWDETLFRVNNRDTLNAHVAHIKLPKLRFVYDPDEVVVEVVEKMLKRWKALGYEIEAISGGKSGERLKDDEWDFMYRRSRMEEPLLDLWEVLLTDDNFEVERLSAFPDWMRQELINLDYATSFNDAQRKMFQIHRHMEAQAFLIPLWEIDEFMALQPNVAEYRGRPISTYHGVERWLVKP